MKCQHCESEAVVKNGNSRHFLFHQPRPGCDFAGIHGRVRSELAHQMLAVMSCRMRGNSEQRRNLFHFHVLNDKAEHDPFHVGECSDVDGGTSVSVVAGCVSNFTLRAPPFHTSWKQKATQHQILKAQGCFA